MISNSALYESPNNMEKVILNRRALRRSWYNVSPWEYSPRVSWVAAWREETRAVWKDLWPAATQGVRRAHPVTRSSEVVRATKRTRFGVTHREGGCPGGLTVTFLSTAHTAGCTWLSPDMAPCASRGSAGGRLEPVTAASLEAPWGQGPLPPALPGGRQGLSCWPQRKRPTVTGGPDWKLERLADNTQA